jgi:hypothetical protein
VFEVGQQRLQPLCLLCLGGRHCVSHLGGPGGIV